LSNQKSKNNSTSSEVSTRSRHKKSNDAKPKPEIKSKRVKKILKSIERIELEVSQIQSQMQKIDKDLDTIVKFLETGKKA
jgi:hypothetical protein